MHDDLAIVIKQAGESFEPPWLDARAVTRRGRRRWWLTRAVAATTSLALIAGGAVVATNVDLTGAETTPAVSGPSWNWERIPEAPIAPRADPATAWTGDELIVWGGYPLGRQRGLSDGAAYDPAAGTWEKLPPAPHPDVQGTSVWTGDELILWGGEREDARYEGMAFDPEARRWRELPESPYWSPGGHSAVWTGEEMIVWGGANSTQFGAAYDPSGNRWREIPRGPLGSRHGHEAAWVGDAMLVWGGSPLIGTPVTIDSDTAAFDPVTDNWVGGDASPLPPLSVPVSVWTGNELVVAGGYAENEASRAAAAWAPVKGWREIQPVPQTAGRAIPLTDFDSTPAWTGSEAVFVTANGVLAYDPRAGEWSIVPAPRGAWRRGATTAWTGDALIVWGGGTSDEREYWSGGWIARD